MGLKGHVCSYQQDVNSIATSLPNLPEKVKAVKMVRTYKDANMLDVFIDMLVYAWRFDVLVDFLIFFDDMRVELICCGSIR